MEITDDVLDSLPKGVVRELSAATLREYAVRMRAQRNKFRAEAAQLRERLAAATAELADARSACRRMAEAMRVHNEPVQATAALAAGRVEPLVGQDEGKR